MPDLRFEVRGAVPVPYAATPLVALKLHVENREADEEIQSVLLRCQVRIDAHRRRYDPRQQERLYDLFGEPSRFRETLRPLLWTNLVVTVPRFAAHTHVELHLPCTFDLEVAVGKLFHALGADGELPLTLFFNGTVFHEGERGLQVSPIPWTQEAHFPLPMRVWKELMDLYHPGRAVLGLSRDVFDRLYEYRIKNGLPNWEDTLKSLLRTEAP